MKLLVSKSLFTVATTSQTQYAQPTQMAGDYEDVEMAAAPASQTQYAQPTQMDGYEDMEMTEVQEIQTQYAQTTQWLVTKTWR